MTPSPPDPQGTLVLDCEALSKAVLHDRGLTTWLATAREKNARVITSAATLVEAVHPRVKQAALQWTLSRMKVEPVTEAIAHRATELLRSASLHGHKHALDAVLAATACRLPAQR